MKTHHLKTIQPYFDRCWNQTKTFEIRKNDRDFQVGDEIFLQEYDEKLDIYSGKEIQGTILYVVNNYPAIVKGYVVFSFSVDKYINPSAPIIPPFKNITT